VGFIIVGMEHKVLKLQKALYILHEASRAWNAKLDDTPLSLGFQRTPAEHAIYVQWNGDAQLVVGVYIDDLIITNSYCDDIKLFREKMATAFKMSDLNLLHCYLGIEVNQSVSGIFLNQCAYAMKLLESCGMAGCNSCHVPIEACLKLNKQSTQSLVDATTYWSIVRSLRYLVNIRLDLAFVVGYVSHFLEEPQEDHLAVMKRILNNVVGTSNREI
jgi:hypothetical protein